LGHCIISNKITHILHRYFPKKLEIVRGGSPYRCGHPIFR